MLVYISKKFNEDILNGFKLQTDGWTDVSTDGILAHLSPQRVTGKQCRPRSETADCRD